MAVAHAGKGKAKAGKGNGIAVGGARVVAGGVLHQLAIGIEGKKEREGNRTEQNRTE